MSFNYYYPDNEIWNFFYLSKVSLDLWKDILNLVFDTSFEIKWNILSLSFKKLDKTLLPSAFSSLTNRKILERFSKGSKHVLEVVENLWKFPKIQKIFILPVNATILVTKRKVSSSQYRWLSIIWSSFNPLAFLLKANFY